MKCNKCRKEFGNGSTCQNCGADKVTALGEFSGYSEQRGLRDSPYVPSSQQSLRIESVPTLICWKCGEVIPGDSKYCPVCQTQLFVVCPKCGHRYSAQYANCNECGTNREEYLKEQELAAFLKQLEEKKKREEEELQRKRQEEALRQAERERRFEEERKRVAREKAEEEKRREANRRYNEARARQLPKELNWLNECVKNNRNSILGLCENWQKQNETNSKIDYTKKGLAFIIIPMLITMGLVLALPALIDWIPELSSYALLLLVPFVVFLIIGVVIANKKAPNPIMITSAVKDYLNDLYYKQTGQRFLYLTETDLLTVLIQNHIRISNNTVTRV